MHSDSAYPARHQGARGGRRRMANVNGAVIPAISNTDTDLNPHNPMYGIHSAGAAGALLVLIGTEATASGGNSMAPSYMVDQTVTADRGHAALGRHRAGQHRTAGRGVLDQADAVDVLESVERISAMKLGTGAAPASRAQDTAIKNLVQCSYVDAAYLVDKYGNALQTLDPTQDPFITGSRRHLHRHRPAGSGIPRDRLGHEDGNRRLRRRRHHRDGRLRLSRRHARHRRDARFQGRPVHRRLPGIRGARGRAADDLRVQRRLAGLQRHDRQLGRPAAARACGLPTTPRPQPR